MGKRQEKTFPKVDEAQINEKEISEIEIDIFCTEFRFGELNILDLIEMFVCR